MKIGLLASHPIQYLSPWLCCLDDRVDLTVFYVHNPSDAERGQSGFGADVDWDVDLLQGYSHTFLQNAAASPDVSDQAFFGLDAPGLYDRISADRFDAFIVMGWHAKAFWQAVWACRRAGVPVLARGDSQLSPTTPTWKQIVKRILYPPLLRVFDGFLTVGTRFHEYLRHYAVPTSALFHVPHLIDVDRFAHQAAQARSEGHVTALQHRMGLSDEDVVFLFVGKFIEKKRPHDFIDALCTYNRATSGPRGAVGVMVGTGSLEAALHRHAASLDAPVHFEGFRNQTELPAYYALADTLVLPSEWGETWGLVVNEAMACGTPALVSDAAGCTPDMIDPGETGYRFPVGDVNALSRCMKRLAASPSDAWRAALAEKTRQHSPAYAADCTVDALRCLLTRSSLSYAEPTSG